MMGIEWEIPRGLRSFFWVCYFHEVGLSRKKPGYSKVNIRRKKRPYVARKMCATQGLKFLFFSWVLRGCLTLPFFGV